MARQHSSHKRFWSREGGGVVDCKYFYKSLIWLPRKIRLLFLIPCARM